MQLFKKNFGAIFVGLVLLVNLQINLMITPALAAEEKSENKPQVWLGPEVKIKSETPTESDKDEKGWLSRNKWWVALGAVLAGGMAAALASGGSSSGGDDSNGDYNTEW
jgi:hypothetical protein